MSVLPVGFGSSGGVDTGDIPASLRFKGVNQYLSFTPSVTGNRRTWTVFGYIRRAKLGVAQYIMSAAGSSRVTRISFDASDRLAIYSATASGGGDGGDYVSNRVFRDPTAFIPIYIEYDSTQATAADRIKVWIGDEQITSWATSTAPTLNHDSQFNWTGAPMLIGQYNSANYIEGYFARFCLTDGTKPGYSAVGYRNTVINEWVSKSASAVKAVVDAGGTNSFMLDFNDATSLTTLGNDYSSKNNDWTLNGFSLTAGTTYDHMLDVPGNSFATLNSINKVSAHTMSNGNLYWAMAGGTGYMCRSTMSMREGKWVAEVKITAGTTQTSVGVVSDHIAATADPLGVSGAVMYYRSGTKYVNGSSSAYGASFTTGDLIRIELNMDGTSVEFFKNGTSQGSIALGTTGLGYTFSGADANFLATQLDFNFGQAPLDSSAAYRSGAGGYFVGTPTTGFKAPCQRNLPNPAILNPSSAIAHRFEAGSGIAAAIASDRSGWTDWLEMFKRTDTTESWKIRFSDDSSNMLAFDTNGAKAAWSAPSTGTCLGLALRVGATYGLVTGTYSGDNTSNRNISHSLGKAPTCGIVKNESAGTWYVWHTKMTGATYFTTLNSATPPAQSATNTPWGTGNWSSTQFMVTNNATNNLNASSNTYRYILFADISGLLALLGHTGNASTDGALEYVGHKAQLQIEKDLAATTGFYVWSDKIDTYNVTGSYLLLNTNAGIATATGIDIVSNAIKHRSTTLANASNAHMDISYARVSGKYSLGR